MNAIIPRAISVEEYYQRLEDHFSKIDSLGLGKDYYHDDNINNSCYVGDIYVGPGKEFPCHNGNNINLDECTIDCVSFNLPNERATITTNYLLGHDSFPEELVDPNSITNIQRSMSEIDHSEFDYLFLKNTDTIVPYSSISKDLFILNRNRESPWKPRIYSAKFKPLFNNEKNAINFLREVYPLEAQIGNKSFEDYIKVRHEGDYYIDNMYINEFHGLDNLEYNKGYDDKTYFNYCVFDKVNSALQEVEITNSLILDSTLDLIVSHTIDIPCDEDPVFNIEKSIISNSEIRLTNFRLDPDEDIFELNCYFTIFNNCKISTHLSSEDIIFKKCIFNNCVFDFVHKPKFIDCRFTHLSNNLDIISRTFDTTKGKKTR